MLCAPTFPREIYNEAGYDLLEPGRQVAALDDLPRVRACRCNAPAAAPMRRQLHCQPGLS